MNKLVLMKPVAPLPVTLNSKLLLTANQKAFFFHSTAVLLSSRRRPYVSKHKNFVRGFSHPFWKKNLLRDRQSHFNASISLSLEDLYRYLENDSFYYSSSWFRQNYQAKRSHDYGGSNFDNYWNSWKCNNSEPQMTSERLTLGLSASGPLTLDEVKNAYRACAMKWHPDHNQGSSKTIAEAKFKSCSAAYQSLLDTLAPK